MGLTNSSSATGRAKTSAEYRKDLTALPVRWSAWLGPRLQSGRTGTDVDSGGGRRALPPGKDERRNRRAGTSDVLTGANGNPPDCGGTGTRSPSKNSTRETQGLTNQAQRQRLAKSRLELGGSPNASLCSLERVVRPAPTERTNGNQPRLRRGNEGNAAGKGWAKGLTGPNERRADERTGTDVTAQEPEPACHRKTPRERLRA